MNRSVKRIIALTALWLCAVFAIAQAPIGVCINNVAQTISNGVIAPIPYATVALCSSGSTAANCVANKVSIYTSTALSTATPTNPFTADAGGNYFFCAAVGHYGVLISSSYGTYFVNDFALVDDWSKGGTMSGGLVVQSILAAESAITSGGGYSFVGDNGADTGMFSPSDGILNFYANGVNQLHITPLSAQLNGNASTASDLASTPTACNPASYFAYGIAANGNALCNALPTPATIYYQTVQEAGSGLAQQPVLNFDSTVVATNGSGKTNVGLPNTGTAGTVTNPSSITTDAQGRVTAVSSAVTSRTCTSSIANSTYACYRIFADGTIEQWGTSNVFGGTVATDISITFPISFTSVNYVVPSFTSEYCTGSSGTCSGTHPFTCSVDKASGGITTSGITVWYDGNGNTIQQGQCAWRVIGY